MRCRWQTPIDGDDEAAAQEAAVRCRQTLQQVLREASDALIGLREQQDLLVKALGGGWQAEAPTAAAEQRRVARAATAAIG